MTTWRKRYVSKKTGEVKVYEYFPSGYYETAEDRALKALKKRPLRRVPSKGSTSGARWTAGQRGPVFQDSTIVKLIAKGAVVCLGDFVELKGAVR